MYHPLGVSLITQKLSKISTQYNTFHSKLDLESLEIKKKSSQKVKTSSILEISYVHLSCSTSMMCFTVLEKFSTPYFFNISFRLM